MKPNLDQPKVHSADEGDSLEKCGLVILETRREPGWSSEVEDKCAQFHFITSGAVRLECEGRRNLLGSDSICHIPAAQKCSQEILPSWPALGYTIRYRPESLPDAINSQLTALGVVLLDVGVLNITQTRVIRSLFQEMLFEQNTRQGGWETVLQSRLMDLAVRTLRLVRRRGRHESLVFEPGDNKIDRVARYAQALNTQFFRQGTITDAARSAGLSRRQFTEIFRKVTGQSWRQYVQSLRLKRAAELLTETEESVMAVSFASGFEDLSHFYHTFKSVYGCSPSAYRAQRGGGPLSNAGEADGAQAAPGFKFRGIKGWLWSLEQYLEEINGLPDLKMNFLMDCDGLLSNSLHERSLSGGWWKPMSKAKKRAYEEIIHACEKKKIVHIRVHLAAEAGQISVVFRIGAISPLR